MIFTSPAFIAGMVISIGIIWYLGTLPAPKKEEKASSRIMSKRESTDILRDSMRHRLKEMNPGMREEEVDEWLNNSKARKDRFLERLDEGTKKVFLEGVRNMQREMRKLERMTEEEIREKMIDIDANKFRFAVVKIVLFLMFVYLLGAFVYETFDVFVVKEKLFEEFQKLFGFANSNYSRPVQASLSNETVETPIDL